MPTWATLKTALTVAHPAHSKWRTGLTGPQSIFLSFRLIPLVPFAIEKSREFFDRTLAGYLTAGQEIISHALFIQLIGDHPRIQVPFHRASSDRLLGIPHRPVPRDDVNSRFN